MSANPTPPSRKSPSPLPLGSGKPSEPSLPRPPSLPQRAVPAREPVATGAASVKPYGPLAPVPAVAPVAGVSPVNAALPIEVVPLVDASDPSNLGSEAPAPAVNPLGGGTERLPGVPGAFSLSRWPGLHSAFDFAERATLKALTGEYEYVWLADLGPEVLESTDPAVTKHLLQLSMLETELWSVRTNPKEFRVTPGGELSFPGSTDRSWDMTRFKLGIHHACMLRLLAAIGLGKVTNPTVRGRTWLVPWPVTRALTDRTAIEVEAALVVMPAGAILQRNATLMLQNAWDLGAEDSDCFVTCLQADPLLISNQQRERWGIGMHLQGRVFWCVEPPETERKAKTPKKPKPQVPAELLREPVARVR